MVAKISGVLMMSQIEDDVCRKIQARADKGLHKYGKSMERRDLSPSEWLVHLQEELMDAVVYIEKLIDIVAQLDSMEETWLPKSPHEEER